MSLAGIQPEDQLTILSLVNLGVTMMQGIKKKPSKKGAGQPDATYDVSRYVTPMKRLLEDALTTGLPTSEYPFVRGTPDDGESKGKKAGGTVAVTGRRLIVFVLGGLTHSEIRGMHEVARALGREIILGTTDMLTPSSYLLGLKDLKKVDGF